MFGVDGPLQIGVANIRAVVAVLDAAGIPIVARDIGGNSGRRAVLDCNSGRITVTTAAGPTRISDRGLPRLGVGPARNSDGGIRRDRHIFRIPPSEIQIPTLFLAPPPHWGHSLVVNPRN